MSESTATEQPLAGLCVLELGHVVAGPYASLMLADLGADVVKIEHPEHGDHMRVAGDTGRAIFAALNRDKQSVALDLTADEDREAFLELASEADVVVENFSAGVMDSLDLGYETLREENESLIYASIKGFQSEGPYADRTATDPIVQALCGLMSVTGNAGSPPARAGTSVIDISTAQNAVVAIVLALLRRRDSGTGESLTIPMFQTGIAMMGYWLVYQQLYGENPARMGASHSLYTPYDVYPTADDGYVFVGVTNDDDWQALREELDLSLDYEDRTTRLDHREEIDDAIAAATTEYECADLVDRLLSKGIPAAPVNEVSDLVDDPHLAAVEALRTIDVDEDEGVRVPSVIPWLSGLSSSENPPALGADTEEIRSWLERD